VDGGKSLMIGNRLRNSVFFVFLLIWITAGNVFGQYEIIITTDSGESEKTEATERLIGYLQILRNVNRIAKSDLSIREIDWAKPQVRSYCKKIFDITQEDLPYAIPVIVSGDILQDKIGKGYKAISRKNAWKTAGDIFLEMAEHGLKINRLKDTTIVIKCSQPDPIILLDDSIVELDKSGKIKIAPGGHTITVKKEKYQDDTQEFELKYGETREFLITLNPKPKPQKVVYLEVYRVMSTELNPPGSVDKFTTWDIDWRELHRRIVKGLLEKNQVKSTTRKRSCDYQIEFKVELTNPMKIKAILLTPEGRTITTVTGEIERPVMNNMENLLEKTLELFDDKIAPGLIKAMDE
jgi:hypothetical protein